MLLSDQEQNNHGIDDEKIGVMKDGECLNHAGDDWQRRRKPTNCASAATFAGATILLLAFASSSVRTSPWRSNHTPTQTTSDPCAVGTWSLEPQIDNRFYGELGVMYSVAGLPEYAEEEFLPLIQYLRDGLHIPDASIRVERRQEKQIRHTNGNTTNLVPQKPRSILRPTLMDTRFALVTQPHLCRSILQPVLSFFDVIAVVDLDNITSTMVQTMSKENDLNTKEEERRTLSTANQGRNTDHKDRLLSIESHNMTKQQQRMINLHRAKAIKVLALSRYAPFQQTIYLDLDMVPCQKNFARTLLRSATKGSIYAGYFDIALPFASHPNVNLPMPSIDKQRHYYRKNEQGHDSVDQNGGELGGRGMNQHNSAAVILNMTSISTRKLLRRFEDDFFSSSHHLHSHLPTLDQPSLGRALYSMFLENGTSLRHVDLDPERVCRKGSRYERIKDQGLADISCGKSNDCVVIHKPVQLYK